jgi:hypothetical protein
MAEKQIANQSIDTMLGELDQQSQFVSPGIREILEGIKEGEQIDQKLLKLLVEDEYQLLTNLGLLDHFQDVILDKLNVNTKMEILRKLYREYMEDSSGKKRVTILRTFLIIAKKTTEPAYKVEISAMLNSLAEENKHNEGPIEEIRSALGKVDPEFAPPPAPTT